MRVTIAMIQSESIHSALYQDLRFQHDPGNFLNDWARPISCLLHTSMKRSLSFNIYFPDMGWRLASRAICPVIAPCLRCSHHSHTPLPPSSPLISKLPLQSRPFHSQATYTFSIRNGGTLRVLFPKDVQFRASHVEQPCRLAAHPHAYKQNDTLWK
ncbi:hypothetical protein TNCV_4564991 [Trichonephila clavipes]|nr:hypothetical protein TNCV_4564991 [Trichonephila clavipes]